MTYLPGRMRCVHTCKRTPASAHLLKHVQHRGAEVARIQRRQQVRLNHVRSCWAECTRGSSQEQAGVRNRQESGAGSIQVSGSRASPPRLG